MVPSFICEAVTPAQRRVTSVGRNYERKHKNCIVCGSDLLAQGGARKTCSSQCSKDHEASRLYAVSCVVCSSEFQASSRRVRYCKKCLSVANAKSHISRSENAKARLARVCQNCSKPFLMKRVGKAYEGKYCSIKCSGAASRKYQSSSERKKAERLRLKDRLGPQPVKLRASKSCRSCGTVSTKSICSSACSLEISRRQREADFQSQLCRCEECKRQFETKFGARRLKYCSNRCGRKHTKRISKGVDRARRRRAAIETVNPIKVFDRDKWKCQFCGTKTPRSLRGTNEGRAPELDHIIPLARGGEHSYANTQCLCRTCNGSKGDKVLGQLRLFG
jgi:5-methylcytosine-specific restriction endonuclease McrA